MDIFYDELHKKIYSDLINKARRKTREHKILFYIISGQNSLFSNVENIYNFKNEELNIENIKLFLERCSKGESILLELALHFFTFRWETSNLVDVIDSLDKKGYFLLKNAMDIYKEITIL